MRAARTLALLLATALSACATTTAADDVDSAWRPGYLWQSVAGHLRMLGAARPVDEVLADPATPDDIRQRLELSRALRDYASRVLALPDNASYRRYADLGRPAAVWNVVAAPELSLQLKTWCFPVLGCVGYRGYFDKAEAEQLAAALRAQGWEASVYGVPAYSTLGRLPGSVFADPLLNTFLRGAEIDLVRLVFHELAHQVAYADGDTTFNESYATAVERIGSRQWLAQGGREAQITATDALDRRRAEFRAMTMRARDRLDALYRSAAPDEEKRREKARLLAGLHTEYLRWRDGSWGGDRAYDAWFDSVNNARLGVLAAYNAQVPAFERLFERVGQDWPRFHAEVYRLAALTKVERDAALAQP
ncbi:aminopeptidase [Sphaerotilus sp.]|uniref:aminopeptidase n=1 Tax=Sphaerotilus sp. TaxID=2093942 RepID=UPI0034E1CBED